MEGIKKIRSEIVEGLERELIGPEITADLDYTINEYPYNRYFTGILSPRLSTIEDTENEILDANGPDSPEEGQRKTTTNMLKFQKQSSFGLTFVVEKDSVKSLEMVFKAGIYFEHELVEEMADGEVTTEYTLVPVILTYRLQNRSGSTNLEPVDSHFGAIPSCTKREYSSLQEVVNVRALQVVRYSGNYSIVTVSISNLQSGKSIENYLFSCDLEVYFKENGHRFVDRRDWAVFEGSIYRNREEISQEFLHKGIMDYAVGHGVSIQWDSNINCTRLRAKFIPTFEVKKIVPSEIENSDLIIMDHLSSTKNLVSDLETFFQGYEQWYREKRERKSVIEDRYQEIAELHLDDIKHSIDRIKGSIEILRKDKIAHRAFQLMNKTMYIMWTSPGYTNRLNDGEKPKWRPFQMAFILFALEGIVNPDSSSRQEVDLLWFPTGGGKSMAYMGLMAFILIYRRLKYGERGAGTAVLSRYTLRLLALQQFQITSTLICSLEILRKSTPDLLEKEFSIGYWVGNNTTPVDVKKAKETLESEYADGASVKQFQACPWCTRELGDRSFQQFIDRVPTAKIMCLNTECPFSGGFPSYMTDEQLYAYPPSIVLGTVDKFARMPKVGESQSILRSPEYRSVDLIVQDELHLINGPLGSMYGIYEMMVEGIIASYDKSRLPKVISSTATIKRAPEHIQRIYGREGVVFPPVGFHANDIYWAKEVPIEEEPGRLYVGIHPQGKSPTNALKAVIAYHLAKVYNMRETYSDLELDPFWTVVGYFSSIRELGSAMMLAVDVIPDRIKQLANSEEFKEIRKLVYPEELTSRLSAAEIAEILTRLEYQLGSPDSDPIDSLFATNMISVGVDIPRLSNMVVVSQPKSTAEYIQATARVGRRYPGIVTVLYNWTRPRDRSHYERFQYYHSTLNTQVDPLSSTPFSVQVRDRALPAVIIGLVRHTVEGMNDEDSAALKEDFSQEDKILDFFRNWISKADSLELDETMEWIEDLFDEWKSKSIQHNFKLKYNKRKKEDPESSNSLMIHMDEVTTIAGFPKRAPNSLRNVESGIDLRIDDIKEVRKID